MYRPAVKCFFVELIRFKKGSAEIIALCEMLEFSLNAWSVYNITLVSRIVENTYFPLSPVSDKLFVKEI